MSPKELIEDQACKTAYLAAQKERYDIHALDVVCEGDIFRAGYAAALAAQPAAVPDGWRLAPVEPTHEMVELGVTARWQRATRNADSVREIYAAMLAAAPSCATCSDSGCDPVALPELSPCSGCAAKPAAVPDVAEALRLADWSGVSIGNKALISKAIELLAGMPQPAAVPFDLEAFAKAADIEMQKHDFHGFEPVVFAVVEQLIAAAPKTQEQE